MKVEEYEPIKQWSRSEEKKKEPSSHFAHFRIFAFSPGCLGVRPGAQVVTCSKALKRAKFRSSNNNRIRVYFVLGDALVLLVWSDAGLGQNRSSQVQV